MVSQETASAGRRWRLGRVAGARAALVAASRRARRAAPLRARRGAPAGDPGRSPPGGDDAGTRAAPTARRGAVTLFDQGLSSISNFAVTVVVARLTGAVGLGELSLAYAGWQVLSALHRALVTDPMTISGDIHDADVRRGIRRGFAAEVLLGLAAALATAVVGVVLVAFGAEGYGYAMLLVSPWLSVLLIQDYWRWIGFMGRRPGQALANDVLFNCVQGACFAALFVFDIRSTAAVIVSWGLGAAVGALYGLRQFRVGPGRSGGWVLLRERWHYSKWLAGDTLLNSLASQSNVVIAGAILGPAGLGGLRAARTLVNGPSGVLMQAGGSLGLPEAAIAYEKHGWKGLQRVSWVVNGVSTLAMGSGVVVMAVWGSTLLSLVYGPSFAHLQTAAVLIGIGFTLAALEMGPLLVLKVTKRTLWILHLQVVNLVASVASMVGLSIALGVDGAAGSTIVRNAVSASGCGWLGRKARIAETQPAAPAGAPAGPVAPAPVAPVAPAPVAPPPGGAGAPRPGALGPSSEPVPS